MRRLILALPVAAVLLAVVSPAGASGPLSAEQSDAVRAYVRDTLDQLGVPGAAVVIVGREGIEFAEGFGEARDDGTPATPQTPFQIASLSKQLTSIAVMQLVASGAPQGTPGARLDLLPPQGKIGSWLTIAPTSMRTLANASAYARSSQGWTTRRSPLL